MRRINWLPEQSRHFIWLWWLLQYIGLDVQNAAPVRFVQQHRYSSLRNRNWDHGKIWPQLDFIAMTYRADGESSETGNYSPQELENFKPW